MSFVSVVGNSPIRRGRQSVLCLSNVVATGRLGHRRGSPCWRGASSSSPGHVDVLDRVRGPEERELIRSICVSIEGEFPGRSASSNSADVEANGVFEALRDRDVVVDDDALDVVVEEGRGLAASTTDAVSNCRCRSAVDDVSSRCPSGGLGRVRAGWTRSSTLVTSRGSPEGSRRGRCRCHHRICTPLKAGSDRAAVDEEAFAGVEVGESKGGKSMLARTKWLGPAERQLEDFHGIEFDARSAARSHVPATRSRRFGEVLSHGADRELAQRARSRRAITGPTGHLEGVGPRVVSGGPTAARAYAARRAS